MIESSPVFRVYVIEAILRDCGIYLCMYMYGLYKQLIFGWPTGVSLEPHLSLGCFHVSMYLCWFKLSFSFFSLARIRGNVGGWKQAAIFPVQ